MPDVAVVGSGPNGLAAAVTMARAGLAVHVYEAAGSAGGGLRTTELIEPGHLHDVCSAVHPMALASPFFREFGLSRRIRLEVPELSHGVPRWTAVGRRWATARWSARPRPWGATATPTAG